MWSKIRAVLFALVLIVVFFHLFKLTMDLLILGSKEHARIYPLLGLGTFYLMCLVANLSVHSYAVARCKTYDEFEVFKKKAIRKNFGIENLLYLCYFTLLAFFLLIAVGTYFSPEILETDLANDPKIFSADKLDELKVYIGDSTRFALVLEFLNVVKYYFIPLPFLILLIKKRYVRKLELYIVEKVTYLNFFEKREDIENEK